ncbi:MAG: hypothetical protein AB7S59_09505 [Parvibaculaceae bacterium]
MPAKKFSAACATRREAAEAASRQPRNLRRPIIDIPVLVARREAFDYPWSILVRKAHMPQAAPPLLDPETCGEDLRQLARRMAEIAPVLCVDCAEYHVKFAMTRCIAPDKSIAVDRPLLIERIQGVLADGSRSPEDFLQIVIAGAADTGVLATAAHAAARLRPEIKARCRFTVLDRCRSPLTLCAEFAEQHGLHVETRQVDLPEGAAHVDADLIIAHSFLRFIDRNGQTALLRKFDTWLKPQGRIIVSQSVRPPDPALFA